MGGHQNDLLDDDIDWEDSAIEMVDLKALDAGDEEEHGDD